MHLLRNLLLLGIVLCAGITQARATGLFLEDSRVRTVVYSENGVFRLITEFGYQSNIEFEKDEQIQTLSVGNPVFFKITPSGNRLFVKALQGDRHTNMTVVTNKRAYQFEISSIVESDADVVYVMRFYYPESDAEDLMASLDTPEVGNISIDEFKPQGGAVAPSMPAMPSMPQPQAGSPAMPAAPVMGPDGLPKMPVPPTEDQLVAAGADVGSIPAMPMPKAASPAAASGKNGKRNLQYSANGPANLAPLEIFDDGRFTFMRFAANQPKPQFFHVESDGKETPLMPEIQGDKVRIAGVHPRISLRFGKEIVCLFNDAALHNVPPQP